MYSPQVVTEVIRPLEQFSFFFVVSRAVGNGTFVLSAVMIYSFQDSDIRVAFRRTGARLYCYCRICDADFNLVVGINLSSRCGYGVGTGQLSLISGCDVRRGYPVQYMYR